MEIEPLSFLIAVYHTNTPSNCRSTVPAFLFSHTTFLDVAGPEIAIGVVISKGKKALFQPTRSQLPLAYPNWEKTDLLTGRPTNSRPPNTQTCTPVLIASLHSHLADLNKPPAPHFLKQRFLSRFARAAHAAKWILNNPKKGEKKIKLTGP